jgi:Sulfatase-modifying factor enzyme 1
MSCITRSTMSRMSIFTAPHGTRGTIRVFGRTWWRTALIASISALPSISATAASVLAMGWVGAHQMGASVWWPFAGDARRILEPSKDNLAAAAKKAVLKEQQEAEVKRKAEAERQRLAAERQREEAEAKRKADEETRKRDPIAALKPGSGQGARDRLTDGSPCPFCPELVVVPSGSFTMGSPANEPQRFYEETQVHVTNSAPFAVGRFAVTFDEWDACVADDGCKGYKPADEVMGSR